MSRTKEEILRDTFTSVEYPDALQRIEIYRAMEQYADQRVDEFKKELKAKVKDLYSEDDWNIATIFKTIDNL